MLYKDIDYVLKVLQDELKLLKIIETIKNIKNYICQVSKL
jgi:hypothetical protein